MAVTPITLNLKTRIALTVLLLFLGCIWLLTYLATTQLKQEFAGVLADQQFSYVSQASFGIEGQIQARFDALDVVAKQITPAVLADRSKLRALLVNQPLLQSYFGAGVVVVSRDGIGLVDFPPAPHRAGAPFGELEYFQDVMATGKPTLGKARIGRFTKALGVAFAVPIRDAKLKMVGAFVGFATLSDNALFGNILNVKIGKSGWIAVSDARYRMIIAINDPKRLLQPFPKPGVNVMLDKFAAGEEGSGVSINSQGREVLSSGKQIGKTGWFVQSVLPTDEAFEPIRMMISRIYVIATVLSLLATLLVWLVIRKLLGPLGVASADIRRMATGEDELAELPVPRQDEIGELLNTFNMLFEQRRAMERVLRESEGHLRAIIENEPECIKVLDTEGRLVQMNPAGLAMIEADSEAQVVGRNIADLVVPAQRQAFIDLGKRVSQGKSGTLEFEVVGLKGGHRWHETHAVPMRDAENQIVGLLAVTRDITAHRAAEAALRESEQMLREAQEVGRIGSYVFDIRADRWTSSEVLDDLFGIDADYERSLAGWEQLLHPAEREDMAAYFQMIAVQGARFNREYRIVRPIDGAERWVHGMGEFGYDELGTPLRLVGTVQDITRRKLAQERLEHLLAEQKAMLDNDLVGIVKVRDRKIVWANPAFEKMLGYASGELVGASTSQTYPSEEAYRDFGAAAYPVLAAGNVYRAQSEHVRKDGGHVWVDISGAMLELDNVESLWAFVDITERRQAGEALKKSEELLRDAQSIAQLGSWELDLTTNVLTWSDEVFRIFEIDPRKFGASYAAFLAAIHPDDRERVEQAYEASLRNRQTYEITHRLLLPDGTIKYVREHGKTSYAADGKPMRSTGTVQDVTLSVLNEESLRESEERFRTIADYTYDWEYWQGPQGEFLYISPSCERVTGYAQADFISKPNLLTDIVHSDDRHLMDAHLQEISHQDVCSLDFRIVHRNGDIRWIAHGCRAVHAKDGRYLGRRASNRDITDRKAVEEQVQQLAYFDTLTGLPNRRMLHDRLDRALLQAKRFGRALAIMFLDLDNFKKINDTLGHDVGDELLKEVAERLKTCVRSGDTVARQGGDEFIIVLAEVAESRDAALVAEKVVAVLGGEPVRIGDQSLDVTTSIGIAVYPINGTDDIQELLKKADKAMYAAKAAGRNGYRFFEA